jgi:hypothetical protein
MAIMSFTYSRSAASSAAIAESRQMTKIRTHTEKAITEMQLYPAIQHRR